MVYNYLETLKVSCKVLHYLHIIRCSCTNFNGGFGPDYVIAKTHNMFYLLHGAC